MNPKQLEELIEDVKRRDREKLIRDKTVNVPLQEMMEELASAPKEEMGKRQPGERCMFEMQRSDAPPILNRP